MSSTTWPPEAGALWAWSCERYGRPGVAEACLALQDEQGAAVGLLLFGCWLGHSGRKLTTDCAAAAKTASGRWQAEVVRPLRQARRHLKRAEEQAEGSRKAALGRLRRSVAEEELAAERIELDELQCLAADCPASPQEPPALAMANLAALMPPGVLETAILDRLVADTLT